MGYGAMGYGVMVLHDTENCALAYGAMQYNYGALGLSAMQKDQIIKILQIQFILYSNFRKGSI
jgi:hypothetical protein